MKYHEMTKNYIFREFECGLTREQTAELCFKSVRTVTGWDLGKPIPPECKRLMRIYCNRQLGIGEAWSQFRMKKDKLEIPTGQLIEPQQILTAIALLYIESPTELLALKKIRKLIYSIERIKKGV
ncbi:phage protein [Vibrio fluvialis]